MSTIDLKPITNTSKNSKYTMAIVLLILLIGPTLIHPSADNSKSKVTTSSPSPDARKNVLQQQPIPQEMFGAYFLSDQGFGSKLIVHNHRYPCNCYPCIAG